MQTTLFHVGFNLTKLLSPPLQNILLKVVPSHLVVLRIERDNAFKGVSIRPNKHIMNIDYILILSPIY